jgi:hypothetical protein
MQEGGADKPKGPELIFGLVGPLGTDLPLVGRVLQDVLSQVEYRSEVHRLSQLMRYVPKEPWSLLKDGPFDQMVDSHMTAGNKLCEILERNDAVALLGIGAIADTRDAVVGDANVSIPRFAHVLRSLKRPKEVETLRRIYGPTFFLVGAHAPRAKRLQPVIT